MRDNVRSQIVTYIVRHIFHVRHVYTNSITTRDAASSHISNIMFMYNVCRYSNIVHIIVFVSIVRLNIYNILMIIVKCIFVLYYCSEISIRVICTEK